MYVIVKIEYNEHVRIDEHFNVEIEFSEQVKNDEDIIIEIESTSTSKLICTYLLKSMINKCSTDSIVQRAGCHNLSKQRFLSAVHQFSLFSSFLIMHDSYDNQRSSGSQTSDRVDQRS